MEEYDVRQIPGQTLILDQFMVPTIEDIEGRWICSCMLVNPSPLHNCLGCGANQPGGVKIPVPEGHDREFCGGSLYCRYCRVETKEART